MKTIHIIQFILVLAALVAVTGCTTGKAVADVRASPIDTVKDITIEAFNFGFTQSDVTINKGDIVRITFRSTEGMHGISIPDLDIDSGALGPGEEKVIEFVADTAGSFDYRCNVPCGSGHRGMKGTIVVND